MNRSKRPAIWGHRGAMDFAPQNSLPSFRLAQEQGADGVELDVQLTKDGVLVVFHDARVEALTDGHGALSSYRWNDLRRLDAGSSFGRSWKGTAIPTLEEVMETLDSRLTVNVEMKTALSEEAWWDKWLTLVRGPRRLSEAHRVAARSEARPLAQAVARVLGSTVPGRFVISSFDPLALEAVGPLLPEIRLGFLHSPTVPWDTPALMETIAHQAWHPHHSQVTAEAILRENAAGRQIHVWTVNDAAHAVRLGALGVDAIITNRPAEILAAFKL